MHKSTTFVTFKWSEKFLSLHFTGSFHEDDQSMVMLIGTIKMDPSLDERRILVLQFYRIQYEFYVTIMSSSPTMQDSWPSVMSLGLCTSCNCLRDGKLANWMMKWKTLELELGMPARWFSILAGESTPRREQTQGTQMKSGGSSGCELSQWPDDRAWKLLLLNKHHTYLWETPDERGGGNKFSEKKLPFQVHHCFSLQIHRHLALCTFGVKNQ